MRPSPVLLLLKTFPDHAGRPGQIGGSVPRAAPDGRGGAPERSADIKTEAEARAYWRSRVAGYRRVQCRWNAKTYRFVVHFPERNEHAFTDHILNARGQDIGGRAFSPDRARLLDGIAVALRSPSDIRRHGPTDDLFVVAASEHGVFKVVLSWDAERERYRFKSAYPMPLRLWLDEARRLPQVDPHGTLGENEPPLGKALGRFVTALAGLPPFEPRLAAGRWADFGGDTSETTGCPEPFVADLDAFLKSIPPGARWITVRPNGPGTEGHPLLIQPSGNGAFRVIGGAGGKLNTLKLTGVRSEAEYADRQKDSAKARRDERKKQAGRDREAGIAGTKAAALGAACAASGRARPARVDSAA
jgi:hypothetical protein